MVPKAVLCVLAAFMLLQLTRSAPLNNVYSPLEDSRVRFHELRWTILKENHDRYLFFLEGSKEFITKVYTMRKLLDNKAGGDPKFVVLMSNFLKTMQEYESLNRTSSLHSLAELIFERRLGEDEIAEAVKYFSAMKYQVLDAARVIKYSGGHYKLLPEEFSFIDDDLTELQKKVVKNFAEYDKVVSSQLERFVSSLSKEEEKLHVDLLEFREEYKKDKDIHSRRKRVNKFFAVNL